MRFIFIGLLSCAVFVITNFPYLHAQEQLQTQETKETGQTGENENLPLITDQPLEIWTFINDYRLITGKTMHLTVQVMWKLGITVNLENADKIDFQPFKVEGITMGERQIFDNDHDYIVITYALSLPPDAKEGIYSIPSFSLSYRNEVDKTYGKAVSSPIAIKNVPVIAEGKVDKDVISLGDRINYTLTIRHKKNVRLLWESVEKLSFSPFEVLQKDIGKKTEGTIEKISIHYVLSLYELGGKKKTPEIPGLPILYYREFPSQYHKGKTDTISMETKEARTEPIPIIINSLLKAVDVPLEGIKGPMNYSKKDMLLRGYLPLGFGGAILLFLCVATVRSSVKRVSSRVQKPVHETPEIARERLKNVMVSFQYSSEERVNRENIQKIDKALRTYLGTLIGISNGVAQSLPTPGFLKYDTQKRLSAETSILTQSVLKQLDALIYGNHLSKEAVDKMLQGIEEIIKQT